MASGHDDDIAPGIDGVLRKHFIKILAGENAVNILFQHLKKEVPPVSEIVEEIPPDIDALIMRAMSREPEKRPASADEFLGMIHNLAA